MLNLLTFSLISLGYGLLFALPGICVGIVLERYKIAPNRLWMVLVTSVLFVFIKRIWFENLSYSWFALILIAGTTIGIYRMDIYWAIKRQNPKE